MSVSILGSRISSEEGTRTKYCLDVEIQVATWSNYSTHDRKNTLCINYTLLYLDLYRTSHNPMSPVHKTVLAYGGNPWTISVIPAQASPLYMHITATQHTLILTYIRYSHPVG